MRALVTGGTGFIGRRLVPRLVERAGASAVTCIVKAAASPLEAEALDRFRGLGVRLIHGDLLRRPIVDDTPPTVDAVFHLAANIDTDASEQELRVNVEGTRQLLEWLRPVSPGVRIVYASSVAVHDRVAEPQGPIVEDSPLTPRTLYGKTKLEGEEILRRRAATDGFTFTILRLPTVYGPGQKAEGLFDKLMSLASRGALLGRIDWPGRTSIVYVDDVANAMIDLAADQTAAGATYCVASDDAITVGQLARAIGEAVGHPVDPIAIPAAALGIIRSIVWSRVASQLMPRAARLSFWRLSLMVSDGFWFDASRFRRAYPKPMRSLKEGLREMFSEKGSKISTGF